MDPGFLCSPPNPVSTQERRGMHDHGHLRPFSVMQTDLSKRGLEISGFVHAEEQIRHGGGFGATPVTVHIDG